jgi:type IX secretion system PorP/SprF family membrane protein
MKTILTIILVTFSLQLTAQQDPLSSMFWNNYAHFNPAMNGLEYKHQGNVTYRNQWPSLSGGPKSIFASYSTLLGENHGVGINYIHEKIGFTQGQILNLNYNYQIRIDDTKRISIGVATGVSIINIDPEWITPSEGPDPTLPTASKTTSSNSNLGIAYSSKKLLVGVGITHLFNNWSRLTADPLIVYTAPRHYFIHGHYKFAVGENFEIRPQALLRTDGVFISTDFNLLFTLRNKYWLGASYRNRDGFAAMMGWDIKGKFRVSYAYDFSVSQLNNGVSGGSHEFGLGILLK